MLGDWLEAWSPRPRRLVGGLVPQAWAIGWRPGLPGLGDWLEAWSPRAGALVGWCWRAGAGGLGLAGWGWGAGAGGLALGSWGAGGLGRWGAGGLEPGEPGLIQNI